MKLCDYLEKCSEKGRIKFKCALYPSKMESLQRKGFKVQRLVPVWEHPHLWDCLISWDNAAKDTFAYELFKKAAKVKPELHQSHYTENTDESYKCGGGWEQP